MSLIELLIFFLLLAGLAVAAARLAARARRSPTPLRGAGAKLSLVLLSLLALFLVVEIAILFTPPATEAWAFTLASRRWQDRYWHPTNSAGMRDPEHTAESLQGRRVLLALGDSFTAGWGIKDREDRYQNVLARALGPEWIAVTLAKGGWHSGHQIEALESNVFPPDAIVLQYFVNDIEAVTLKEGVRIDRESVIPPPPPLLRPLVENSHLLDLVYWRLIRFARRDMNEEYNSGFQRDFADSENWAQHREQLTRLAQFAQQSGKPVIVLAIPELSSPDQSRSIIARVVEHYRSLGVPVVDVSLRIEGRPSPELTVNRMDSHANEALHAEMAGWLHAELVEQVRDPD